MFKKHLGLFFNVIAIGLFVPGILLPMFTLNMEMLATIGASNLSTEVINKELSIIGTIEELWQDQRILVALLIFAFSIVIPITKTLLLIWGYFMQQHQLQKKVIQFVSLIGKWSMADVFVVAIFLAVLSTQHAETANQHSFTLFGFKLDLLLSSETLSAVGVGFYYFVGYCLLSLLGNQFSLSALKTLVINQVTDTETNKYQ